MDNFDLRKFLAENKLTTNSRLNEEAFDITKEVQLGDVLVDVQGDMYEVVAISPSQVELEPFNFKGDNSIFPDDFGNDVSIEDFWQHLTAREEEEPKGPFGEPWDTNYFGNHIKKSKPLKENTFKVGQEVTYLGHPAVVTATKEYNGRNFVSVSYDKGTGKTKASNILATSGDVKPLKAEIKKLDFAFIDGTTRLYATYVYLKDGRENQWDKKLGTQETEELLKSLGINIEFDYYNIGSIIAALKEKGIEATDSEFDVS